MLKSILFIISFMTLFIALMLIKKKEEKISIGINILLNFIFASIINSTIVFIFSTILNLPANLIARSIIFLIISFILFYKICKKKEVQKYKFDISNLIFLVLIVIFVSYIGVRRFGKDINLTFETTDPAVHMLFAERFSESDKLLEDSISDYAYGESSRTMFYSYTTVGTIVEVAHSFINSIYIDTKIFILFEISVLFLIAIMSYYLINNLLSQKNKKNYLINLIMTIIICLMIYAYPYNSVIFGFHYLNLFLLISIGILLLYKEFVEDIENKYFITLLLFFNFFIFSTYYMFVPVIFGSQGLYFLYECFVRKKIDFKNTVKIITITLLIPFIVGMVYYIISPKFYSNSSSSTTSTFKLEGYIYRNLMGNILLLVPVFLIQLFTEIKRKKISLLNIMILFAFAYLFIQFYFFYKGDSASYYFYKNYYFLSPLLFISLANIISLKKENYKIGLTIFSIIIFTFLIYKLNIENRLKAKNVLINPVSYSTGLTDIYSFNDSKEDIPYIYTKKEMLDLDQILKEYKESFDYENFFYYTPSLMKRLWSYDYIRIPYTPKYKGLNDFYMELKDIDEILNYNNLEYVLVNKNDDIVDNRLTLIKENESFKLYKIVE